MSGGGKARAQRRHALRRFYEREGLEVSLRDLAAMASIIQRGEHSVVERQSNRVTVCDIEFEGGTRRVVYDHHRKTVVTVLPREDA